MKRMIVGDSRQEMERMIVILNYIAIIHCPLKTLRLIFDLYAPEFRVDVGDGDWLEFGTADAVASDKASIKEIATLTVRDRIEISVTSNCEETCTRIGFLARRIGIKKRWVIANQGGMVSEDEIGSEEVSQGSQKNGLASLGINKDEEDNISYGDEEDGEDLIPQPWRHREWSNQLHVRTWVVKPGASR